MTQLSKTLHKEMNIQIQEEVFSAYLYYAMSAWFETNGLLGFAKWMRVQAMEELTHGQRFYVHILERENVVELLEIHKPDSKWESPLAAAKAAYEHEKHITARIHKLMGIARKDSDFTAEIGILNWFVNEQIEEEQNTGNMAQQLDMIGDSKSGLYQLDKEMGMRAFVVDPTLKW